VRRRATVRAIFLLLLACAPHANAQAKRPNVVYFLVDNLGMGELSSYSVGPFRGVTTARIDAFAKEGMRLTNFAPEAQCTLSRSALMTGRYSIRSGNHTVALAGSHSGLVRWERTLGDIFSDAGYATAIDVEYMKRAKTFLKRSTDSRKPFFLYFCHSMMHLPNIPRLEFKGKRVTATGRTHSSNSTPILEHCSII
jgi:arylsulfatase A-like enzyme